MVYDEEGKGEQRQKWDRRLSGQAWLWDERDEVAKRVSQRAATLTGLTLGNQADRTFSFHFSYRRKSYLKLRSNLYIFRLC